MGPIMRNIFTISSGLILTMKSTRILWVWLLVLPWCSSQEPKKLSDIIMNLVSDEKVFLTNKKMSSLRDIFGFNPPIEYIDFYNEILPKFFVNEHTGASKQLIDRDQFKPNVKEKLAGFEYIHRPHYTLPYRVYDKPVEIVELINELSEILFLVGRTVKVGKTVDMAKIHESLIENDPALWTIPVDASNHFKELHANEITEEFLFDTVIQKQFKFLFAQVLKHSPKRILILFDNVDYMPVDKRNAVISLIDTLWQKGIRIVMTGHKDLLLKMQSFIHLDVVALYMSPLTHQDKGKYLRNYWEKRMVPFKPEYNERLDEYVEAMNAIMHQYDYYRSFLALQVFAEEFTRKRTILNHEAKSELFEVGCLDYVVHQRPLPSTISQVLRDVPFNNMNTLHNIMKRTFRIVSDYNMLENMNDLYDQIGMMFTFQHDPTLPVIYHHTSETVQYIANTLGINTPNEHTSISYGYREYFTANRILTELRTGNYHTTFGVFNRLSAWNYHYRPIVQLIDSKIHELHVNNFMFVINSDDDLLKKTLDRLIVERFVNLFDLIATHLMNNQKTALEFIFYIGRLYTVAERLHLPGKSIVSYGTDEDLSILSHDRLDSIIEQNMIRFSPWVEKFPFGSLSRTYRMRIFEALIKNIVTLHDTKSLKTILNRNFLNRMTKAMRFEMATKMKYRLLNVDISVYVEINNIARSLEAKKTSKTIKSKESASRLKMKTEIKYSNKLEKIINHKEIVGTLNNIDDIHRYRNLLKKIDTSDYYGIGDLLENHVKKIAAQPVSSSQADARSEYIKEAFELANTLKSTRVESNNIFVKCLSHRKRRTVGSSISCFFNWNDIDHFNDAHEIRNIDEIRVNSDKFLTTLAKAEGKDHRKATQLVDLVKYLEFESDSSGLLRGKSKMRFYDVLRQKSLKAYRQIQRIPEMMKIVLQQPSTKKSLALSIPIKGITIYAAAAIPFIKGLYGTITTCLIQTNGTNKNCLMGSGALAVSTLGLAAGLLNPRYIHWSLEVASTVALDMLPLGTPDFIRNNIRRLQGIKLESTAKALYRTGIILAVASLGFDVYNIIDMAMMIDMCSRPGNECLSKDQIDYIISLTFSTVSLVVTGGLIMTSVSFGVGVMIGLALLLVDMIATGINDVFYYSNKYDTDFGENADIFFNKIIGRSPSERVESYVRRADWVHVLEKHVNDILESNEHVVAYAMGIGKLQGDIFIPNMSNINMANSDKSYTSGLSRVIPAATNRTILLCLPREDKAAKYEKYPNTVPEAEYLCSNSFVIARKHQWNKTFDDTLYIIYDLILIEEGTIVGSNTYNNRFLISNSSTELNILGGFGNIINHFKVQSTTFHGNIFLHGKSLRNILDLSNVNSSALYFKWHNELQQGRGEFKGIIDNTFTVQLLDRISPNLHVIGRDGEIDVFSCDYHRLVNNQTSIIVDSRGGQSIANMDYVADCEISVVRPYTRIVGSNSTNIIYTAHVWLEHNSQQSNASTVATIEPRQSTFMVAFVHRPFFSSIDKVIYIPVNKTLNFIFQHTDSTTLSLSIVPYHSGVGEIERANCIFMDSYTSTTITPIIHESIDGKDIKIITHFNILSTINSSRLSDVIKRYHYVSSVNLLSNEFHVITKLNHPTTNQTFTIGSAANERFLIESTTTLLHGGNGADVYVLNRESSNSTWIDNEADDDALDTLIIPDTTCNTLHAESGSFTHEFTEASMYDVTLFCSIHGKSTPIRIVLRKYLMESGNRHLQIYWHGAMYSLLPTHWISKESDKEATRNIEMALVISFNGEFSEVTTVILTTLDSYILFNITDEETNPLVAFKSGLNDVIIARQSFNWHSALVVVLQEFFINGTDDIANDWLHPKIFKVNGTIQYEDILPRTLNPSDIKKLYLDTLIDNKSNGESGNFIEEYLVDFTNAKENHTIVIDHNKNISRHHGNYKFGVLAIVGAEPYEFNASWVDNNGTSLALCARQTCIHIRNWCKRFHRILRIEFFLSLDHRPIIINIDKIKCKNIKGNDTEILYKLNRKFIESQQQLPLTNDNDNFRLIKCVGTIFSDIITNSSMFELFGFTSALEQRHFVTDNCGVLFTIDNLNNLSLTIMNETLTQMVKVYSMKTGITSKEKEESKFIQNALAKLDSLCWQRFTTLLIKFNDGFHLDENDGFVHVMDDASSIVAICLKNSSTIASEMAFNFS